MSIVCLGDLMVDVLALLPGPLAPGSDTPAPVRLLGGGAAANVAAWAVAAGGTATFVGRVGDDALGTAAVAELRATGVDVLVDVDPDAPTGTCIVLVDPSGERTMIPSGGANGAAGDRPPLPESADWLYVSGYALLAPGARPAALGALEAARARGWRIAVDAASAAPLRAADPEAFLGWAGSDVLLFANADEAQVLTGIGDPVDAARALGARCGAAVVKRGAGGAVWSDGVHVRAAGAPACEVIDSTGAGDAFAAGYLVADGDVDDRLAAGVLLAARAVSRRGARP